MMTLEQMRAARGLLGWSQADLAEHSGVSLPTVKRMESVGPGRSSGNTVQAVEDSLVKAGVQFIPENGGGAGVRLARPKSQ